MAKSSLPKDIATPQVVFDSNSPEYKYFVENKLFLPHANTDKVMYADAKEVAKLIGMSIEIINRAGMNRDLDFVKSHIVKLISAIEKTVYENNGLLTAQINTILNDKFDDTVDGSYLSAIKTKLDKQVETHNNTIKATIELLLKNAEKLSTDKMTEVESKLAILQEKLNPDLETSYLGLLKRTVTDVQEELLGEFDTNNLSSFVNKLTDELEKIGADDSPLISEIQSIMDAQAKIISDKFIEMRELLAKEEGKEEMLVKTAQLKGQNFEDELFETLQLIAKPFGDNVEMTGTKAEVGGSKKGDFMYTFAEGMKVVIEAKDTKLTLPPMIKYLNDAMQTRDCTFSILIAKDESCLPKQIGNFNFYDDNKLFVTADFIEHAIRWTRLFFGKIQTETVEGIDKSLIERSLKTIQTSLKTFTVIKSKLTKLDKATNSTVNEISILLNNIQSELDMELSFIAEELNNAD